MAAITFPASPALNDIHTVGTRSWKFNGTAWKLVPKTTDAILEGSNNLYYTDARVAAAPAVTALETRAGTIEGEIGNAKNRLDTAESAVSILNHIAGELTARADTAEQDIDNLESNATQLQGQVDGALLDITGLRADLTYIDNQVSGLGGAFRYRGTVEGGESSEYPYILPTLPSDRPPDEAVGYYFKVSQTGWFIYGGDPFRANVGDGLVVNSSYGIDIIDNTNSTVAGTANEITVTGSTDTGYTVALDEAFKNRLSSIEVEISDARQSNASLNDRIANKADISVESDIDALEVRASDLEDAIAELEGEVQSLDNKQIKNVLAATAPSHVEGLIWIDTTDMSSYVSYAGAWIEMDRI